MSTSYDLKSILDAIENINTKSVKKSTSLEPINVETIKKSFLPSEDILPSTEQLILQAEEQSNKLKNRSIFRTPVTEDTLILQAEEQSNKLKNKSLIGLPVTEDTLILVNEYKVQDTKILNLEEIKLYMIEDLYSSLTQKVKKNTLKIIFELREKIVNLEEEIKILSLNRKFDTDSKDNSIHKINEEHIINENTIEDEKYITDEYSDDLPNSLIKTLKLQNSIIKKLEKNEEKLLLSIVDLEQDISILGNKKNNLNKHEDVDSSEESINNLDTLTKTSVQQNSKTQNELIFFKENYEKLIIENNEVKKKLSNSKERIVIFEKNIKDLESGFENLGNILSKSSVIKLNDPLLKISSKNDRTKIDS